jgi:hypothetical protein
MKRGFLFVLLLAVSTIAATYYLNGGNTDAGRNGTTPALGWATVQEAVDGTGGTPPAAGDTVLMYKTNILAASIDFDGGSGSGTGRYIYYIGCDSVTQAINGTKFRINCSAVVDMVATSTSTFIWFENVIAYGAQDDAFGSTIASWVVKNSIFYNITDVVFYTTDACNLYNVKSYDSGRFVAGTRSSYFSMMNLSGFSNGAFNISLAYDDGNTILNSYLVNIKGSMMVGLDDNNKIRNNTLANPDSTGNGIVLDAGGLNANIENNVFMNLDTALNGGGSNASIYGFNIFCDDNTRDTINTVTFNSLLWDSSGTVINSNRYGASAAAIFENTATYDFRRKAGSIYAGTDSLPFTN